MKLFGLITLFLIAALAAAFIVSAAYARQDAGGRARKDTTTAMTNPTTTPNTATASPRLSKAGFDITPLSAARVAELAKALKPEEAKVILKKGTEPAFCGNLLDNHKDGFYACRLCGLPLFASDSKFESGTGWPSFFKPYDPAHVREESDRAYGMVRTEILCARCGAHLGHVFDDGPAPTNKRFCLNSVSLKFYEKGEELPAASTPLPPTTASGTPSGARSGAPGSATAVKTETAYFAGGCFWGVEDRFQQTPGVLDAVSGYMGGKSANPTYKDVCAHGTGHAETVKIVYDPAKVSYHDLLEKFFKFHNPTQLNRQGPDVGDQYRSAIFASSDAQLQEANRFIEEQAATPRFKGKKIVTQVAAASAAGKFYDAEEYHQDYHIKHGGHCALPEE